MNRQEQKYLNETVQQILQAIARGHEESFWRMFNLLHSFFVGICKRFHNEYNSRFKSIEDELMRLWNNWSFLTLA